MSAPRFAGALSTLAESQAAFDEVVREIRAQLTDAHADLVCVFANHHHGVALEDLGPRLARALETRALIGCTGESVIGPLHEVERGPALSVFAASMPDTHVRPFQSEIGPTGPDQIGFTGFPVVEDPARAGILLFADPYSFPTDEYLERIDQRAPSVPVVGGMASGGTGPGENFLFTQEGLVAGGAVGVVIEGAVELRSIVSQGCRPVGKPYVITACKQNLVQKLSGKPALDALRDTLENLPADDCKLLQRGPFLGLAIDARKSAFARGDFLARAMIDIDQEQGALAIADTGLRNGMSVQFLVRDATSAGEDLAQLVGEQARGGPAGVLLFSCNGRGSRMFTRAHHDITSVQGAMPSPVPAAGFFAAGEIGPVGGRNFLHGLTASVALLRSRV